MRMLLLLAALLSMGFGSAVADERVPNGDLEQANASGDWPESWGRPKVGGEWAEEDGNRFIRLTSPKPGETVLLYQQFQVPRGAEAVELKMRLRATGIQRGEKSWYDARVMIDLKDAGEKKLGSVNGPTFGRDSDGWVERSVKFLIPDGTLWIAFMPTVFMAKAGTLDVDDVSLVETDAEPLREEKAKREAELLAKRNADAAKRQQKAAKQLASEGNLISNGDLETAIPKKPNAPLHWGVSETTTWEQEGDNHFLRLRVTEPGSTTLVYRLLDLTADRAYALSWRQRVTDLKTGKEAWHDARILMNFKDAAGKKIGSGPSAYTRKSTDGWQEKSISFLAPDEAVSIEFMPSLMEVERGTFDLDDLVLKPTDPQELIAKHEEQERIRKAAIVDVEEPDQSKWPESLHVEGNQIVSEAGNKVWLQGVNVVSLEWNPRGEQVMKAAKVATEDWGANIIRLPVTDKWWFGRGDGQKDQGEAYRQLVDDVITFVANRGKYVLLDLHRFGAPKQEHAEFWSDAAKRYANHPAVLFDVFNEPHGMTWDVWRNGGEVAEKKSAGEEEAFLSEEEKAKIKATRQSIGMQKLIDVIRETGAKNALVCGGLDYAYDVSGFMNGFALDDRGGNGIILSTHIYPWKKGWAEKVLVAVDSYPILVGEVGAGAEKMSWLPAEVQEDATTWVPAMLGLIQKHKLHWTAFAFRPKAGPPILKDWRYEPNDAWGVHVKRALSGEQYELDRLR